MTDAALFSSESAEWYTPPDVIARVLRVLGSLDLDPCSNSAAHPNVPARVHYTIADDGLSQPWFGRVYVNPPYGDLVGDWITRLVTAYLSREISTAIALTAARTDTNWIDPLLDFPVCLWHGRMKFSNPVTGETGPAPFPTMLTYLGVDIQRFVDNFEDAGRVLHAIDHRRDRALQLNLFSRRTNTP